MTGKSDAAFWGVFLSDGWLSVVCGFELLAAGWLRGYPSMRRLALANFPDDFLSKNWGR
jgi:hypothetical protein